MSYQSIKTHGRNLNAYYSVKEASLQRLYTVWFQLYMTFWKRQNCGDSKKTSDCQRLEGREEWIGGTQSTFGAVKLLYMMLWMGACIVIHKSKPIGCTPPRVNLNTNYGLKVMMMCQGRFISCNKCTPLVKDFDNGGDYA